MVFLATRRALFLETNKVYWPSEAFCHSYSFVSSLNDIFSFWISIKSFFGWISPHVAWGTISAIKLGFCIQSMYTSHLNHLPSPQSNADWSLEKLLVRSGFRWSTTGCVSSWGVCFIWGDAISLHWCQYLSGTQVWPTSSQHIWVAEERSVWVLKQGSRWWTRAVLSSVTNVEKREVKKTSTR